MRRSFGIFFLIIGLLMTGLGIFNMTLIDTPDPTPAVIPIVIGILFSISGLIMIRAQKKKEEESAELNKILTTNISTQKTTSEDNFSKLEKLGKLKEQGILTDEEFQQQKKNILE